MVECVEAQLCPVDWSNNTNITTITSLWNENSVFIIKQIIIGEVKLGHYVEFETMCPWSYEEFRMLSFGLEP